MKVDILKITPLMASEFLSSNKSNRKINKKQLEMIIRTIVAGKWKLTHQGVAFYSDGELADGQHRLQAIVKTGIPLTMPVFQGIERNADTILAIDCGRGRTVTDSAAISGIKIKPTDISIAKGLKFGYADRSFQKMTHTESCDLCEEYSDDINNIKLMFPKIKAFITLAPVKVAVANAIKDGVSIDVASKFCNALVSGEYSDPLFVNAVRLRSKLITRNYNGGGDRVIAYNMTYNTLIKTGKGIEVKRLVEGRMAK